MIDAYLPILGARVTDASVDSECTVLVFDNGSIMRIDGEWNIEAAPIVRDTMRD